MAKAPPPPSEAAAALVAGAQANAAKYGVRALAAANVWAAAAGAAGPAWSAGVTAPGAQQRLISKIRRAGAAGYSAGVQEKGTSRFGPGVAAGQNKYAANVAPYFSVIQSTAIPPKGIRGSPANLERVRVLAAALTARRVGTAAAGGG